MAAIPPPNLYDRILAALKLIIRGELAELSYLAVYEYTVQAVTPVSTPMGPSCLIDGSPADTTVSMPAIANVPVCPGLLAEAVVATVGMLCRVRFVNGQPSRPEVCGFIGGVDASGALFGTGSPAARVNDVISVAFPPVMQLSGVLGVLPFTGIAAMTMPGAGVISTGSTKLKIGG
jgi:hypothetical protein